MSYAPNYNPVTGEYTPRKRRLPRRRVIPTSRNKGTPLDPFSIPFSSDPVDFVERDFKPTMSRPRVRPVNRNAPMPPEVPPIPIYEDPRPPERIANNPLPKMINRPKIDKSGRGRKRTFEPDKANARDRSKSKSSQGRPRGPQGPQGGSKKIGPSRPKPKSPPKQVRSAPKSPKGPQSKPKALPRRRAQAVQPKRVPKTGIARRRVIPKRR